MISGFMWDMAIIHLQTKAWKDLMYKDIYYQSL